MMISDIKLIENARHELVDRAAIALGVIALIVVPFSFTRAFVTGWAIIFNLGAILAVLLAVIGYFREKLSFQIKAGGMITILFIAGISNLFGGFIAVALIAFLTATFLCVTFYGLRYSVALIILGGSLIALKGVSITFGATFPQIDYNLYFNSMWGSLSIAAILVGFGLTVVLVQSRMNQMLENIIVESRTLKGLLPICAHCKKIRDDEGYWNQIEVFIHEHSEAEFSHGICYDCAIEFYPDIDFSSET